MVAFHSLSQLISAYHCKVLLNLIWFMVILCFCCLKGCLLFVRMSVCLIYVVVERHVVDICIVCLIFMYVALEGPVV